MKRNVLTKIVSVILVSAMLAGVIPGTAVAAVAAEAVARKATEKDILAASDELIREAESRQGVVKDRSKIPSWAQAAVYVGDTVYSGAFSPMWNLAMEHAPTLTKEYSKEAIEAMPTVEFVLNTNLYYDETWFGEKTMTVTGKKLTIDLNGHAIYRKDHAGSVIHVNGYSVLTIMDSNPHTTNSAYAHEELVESLGYPVETIRGGVIAGGYYSTGDGGGLRIEDHSTVYMLGGTVSGNKADVGSGVYLADGSTLDMRGGNAQICYNYSAGTSSDGGAIYLGSDCRVYGGNVHHNLADDYGGGVRAKGNNIVISDMIIHHNRALEEGGGLYIERSTVEQTVTVNNCVIVKNFADEEGGGVYIYDLYMVKMSHCTVQNNAAADAGGGIHLSDYTGTDLQISGKMTVRYNYVAPFSKMYSDYNSNLYLEGDDDLIVGSMSTDSEVWIRIEEDIEDYCGPGNCLTAQPTSAVQNAFYSDVDGYHVTRQNIPAKENYRHLYFEKGERTLNLMKTLTDYATVQLPTPYQVQNGAYKGMKTGLYRGYAQFTLSSTNDFMGSTPFYYSDGYFLEDPKVYNEHLSTLSLCLALSAFGVQSDVIPENAYANHFANVKQMMAEIGCADEDFFVNEDYGNKPVFYGEDGRLSTIGVAISQKNIYTNDASYVLVPVAIRGRDYGAEWGSNTTLGTEGEAKGFSDAATQVYGYIMQYLQDHELVEKAEQGMVKFWIVGYSRAGATANLTAKRLVDAYAKQGNAIFGYTFEAPQGGVEGAKSKENHTDGGRYLSIHNIINENDLVPLVGPSEMGFLRYGTDHLIGADHLKGNGVSYDPNSAYYKQRMLMVKQLKAINPYYCFDDYWEVADVNIILSNLPIWGTDMIDKGDQIWDDPNEECYNIYLFNRWFVHMVQQDGLELESISEARKVYATEKFLANIQGNAKTDVPYSDADYNFGYSDYTAEQAISGLVQLLFGLWGEPLDMLKEILLGNVSAYMGEASKLDLLSLYFDAVRNWDTAEDSDRVVIVNDLLQNILNGKDDSRSIWDMLTEEQADLLAQSLPVVIWILLNYAGNDANTDDDDGMWGVGTFANNMGVILSNHYQEITLAWLRSHDSYYESDLQAYMLEKTSAQAPTVNSTSHSGMISLQAEKGSSVFYSIDGGKNWLLYTKPVAAKDIGSEMIAFAVSYGAKSEVVHVVPYEHVGTMLTTGSYVFMGIAAVLAVAAGVAVYVGKKKRKSSEPAEAVSED